MGFSIILSLTQHSDDLCKNPCDAVIVMERSRKIFLEILCASHGVIITANRCADHKGLSGDFQQEGDMRRISVTCDTLADILSRSTLLDDPAFDVKLQDWLSGGCA